MNVISIGPVRSAMRVPLPQSPDWMGAPGTRPHTYNTCKWDYSEVVGYFEQCSEIKENVI